MPTTLSRRTLLRGMLGGATLSLGLPALECMLNRHGTALASGTALPVRYGTWFWGCGVCPEKWIPQTTGANWETTSELAPLDVTAGGVSVKSYINLTSGMQTKLPGRFTHYPNASSILAGNHDAAAGAYGEPGGPTLDVILARQWAGRTPVSSLQVGVAQQGDNLVKQNDTSWLGDNMPNAMEFSPAALYNTLFSNSSANLKQIAGRKSVLDFVQGDMQRLRSRVGTLDAQRLQEHAQNIRQIETGLDALAKLQCVVPNPPVDPAVQVGSREPLQEVNRLFADLLVLAMQCDITRVFALQFISVSSNVTFWQVGGTGSHHGYTHAGSDPNPQVAANARDIVDKSVTFMMGELSYMVQKLASTPEGAGNMLDNSLVFATSELSDGTTHDDNNHPSLLIGRAGGAMKYPGIHYKGVNEDNATRISLTALRAVGASLPSLGVDAAATTASIPDLLA